MATTKPTNAGSNPAGNLSAPKGSIEIAGKKELLEALRDGAVGESDFGVDLVTAEISAAPNVGIEGLSFSIGAGAGAEIRVFNSVDDEDPEAVVATVNKEKKEADPPILAAGSGAWLKYRLWANAKASGAFKNPFLTSSLTGSRELALCDYRLHPASQPVREALTADLGSLRLVTRASDVAGLGTGDVLALRAAGELKFALSLRWSDVLSSNLGGFLARLAPKQLVAIKTSVGASISATVSAKDEFLLAFVGLGGDRIGVSLRKVDQTVGRIEGEVGVKVELADPKATKRLLDGLIQAAIGSQVDQVDAILAKTDLSQLSTTEQKVVAKLVEAFGLEPVAEKLALTRKRWDELKGKLDTAVDDLVKMKLEAGFRYEYQRIDTSSTLFRATLSRAKVKGLHAALLRCEPGAVQAQSGDAGVEIEKFLQDEKSERSRAWGFGLSLGKWRLLGRDQKSFIFSRQLNKAVEPNLERVAYRGVRGYEGKVGGSATAWSVDFKADTSRFAQKVLAKDLYLGLHFHYEHAESKMSDDELRQAIDEAIVWRILDEADEERVFAAVRSAASAKKKVATRLDLKVDHAGVTGILPGLDEGDLDPMARALARAMPWREGPDAREVVPLREQVYAPLWKWALSTPNPSGEKAAQVAVAALGQSSVAKDLVSFERMVADARSFAWLVEKNPRTSSSFRRFVGGLVNLRTAIELSWEHDRMKEILSDVQEMFRQYHHVRAAGAFVVDRLARSAGGLDGVEGTFTVELPEGEELTFATSK